MMNEKGDSLLALTGRVPVKVTKKGGLVNTLDCSLLNGNWQRSGE